MKKRMFDADSLEDYDIERIADKIEDTGRIATAVHSEVCDQIRQLTKLLEDRIDRRVAEALKSGSLELSEDMVKNEVKIKLIKYLLEEEK